MFQVIILHLWLIFKGSQTAFVTNENWLLLNPSVVGFGSTLNQIENTSVLTCGHECVLQTKCTAANYFPTNQTCTLLNVEDVLDDWETNDNVTYISMDCEPGPKGMLSMHCTVSLCIVLLTNNQTTIYM